MEWKQREGHLKPMPMKACRLVAASISFKTKYRLESTTGSTACKQHHFCRAALARLPARHSTNWKEASRTVVRGATPGFGMGHSAKKLPAQVDIHQRWRDMHPASDGGQLAEAPPVFRSYSLMQQSSPRVTISMETSCAYAKSTLLSTMILESPGLAAVLDGR